MSIFPSHNNSANERTEMRSNWKTEMRRSLEMKKPEISRADAIAKMDKMAAALVANESVSQSENCYKVRVGTGKRFYPVYLIKSTFFCACADDERYGICAHVKAAEIFAARAAEARNTASEDFHFQAGEIELHYENDGYRESA